MQKKCIHLILEQKIKYFVLSLHYNGDSSYLFVNGKEVTKFKAKKSEIKANQLTFGSISTDKIVDIHDYLMNKNGII